MDIVKISAICIIATVICKVLDNQSREISSFVKIAAAFVIFTGVSIYIAPVIEDINNIFMRTAADDEFLSILFKSAGICYISQFACDICRDNGENLLATHAELAGKIALIITALPLVDRLTELISRFSGY